MKIIASVLLLSISLCLPAFAQKSFDDYDSCIQSADCTFTCWYDSRQGNYSLAANERTVRAGKGMVSMSHGELLIADNQPGLYLLKISVSANTAKVALEDQERSLAISFNGERRDACSCPKQ
jgi:hypothetical protein